MATLSSASPKSRLHRYAQRPAAYRQTVHALAEASWVEAIEDETTLNPLQGLWRNRGPVLTAWLIAMAVQLVGVLLLM